MLTKNPGFYQVLLLFQSGIDFSFLLTSFLLIFPILYFPDGIFSFTWSTHSAFRLCSTLVLPILFQNAVASSAFGGFVLSSLPSRFLKNLPSLVWKFVLKLFYSVVISLYFSGFSSYSLFQFFHYQCKSFSSQPILFI